MKAAIVILLLLAVAPVSAQDPPAELGPNGRRVVDVVSTAEVATAIGLDTLRSWRAPDRARAFARQGLRLGVTFVATETLKRLTRRERPDRSDRLSFPSQHTAFTVASCGGLDLACVSFSATVGLERIAVLKHFPSDVGAGAALGGLVRWVFR